MDSAYIWDMLTDPLFGSAEKFSKTNQQGREFSNLRRAHHKDRYFKIPNLGLQDLLGFGMVEIAGVFLDEWTTRVWPSGEIWAGQ